MKQKGFTLIELLVVMAITTVLGALTIAGVDNYNHVQVLQTSTNEVVTMLNEAKSRAQSQVKLGNCSEIADRTLVDYRVDISQTNNSYSLSIDCQDSSDPPNIYPEVLETENLPKNVSFTSQSSPSFSFPVISGGVQAVGIIKISGSGKTKMITVSALGGISVQND